MVAPRAGAWIETSRAGKWWVDGESHPVRVRGLKLYRIGHYNISLVVAPRAGAWIETENMDAWQEDQKSHPVRVRGLKPVVPLQLC